MADLERTEVAQQVCSDLLTECMTGGLNARELARDIFRVAKKMVCGGGSNQRRRAVRIERFMSPDFVEVPEGAAIRLLPMEAHFSNIKAAPKPYGLIRRLATDLRYQDNLELAIVDVFEKAEALIDTMPLPNLAHNLSLPALDRGKNNKSARKRLLLASSQPVPDYNVENLVIASLCGDLGAINEMLDMKARDGKPIINVDGVHVVLKYTALHASAEFGQLEASKLLVERGANINARCARFERTPLFYAATHRRHEIARFLISKGASRRLRDADGLRAYQVVEVADQEDEKLRDFLRDPPGRVPAVILKTSLPASLRIEWDENMFDKKCSRIDYYVVRWRVKPHVHEAATRYEEFRPEGKGHEGWLWDKCQTKWFEINDLLPATDYIVQVAAHSQVGYGPPSRPNTFRTRETLPEPPASAPLLVRSSPDNMLLCVKPPIRDNGHPITSYIVYYRLYSVVARNGVETKATRTNWLTYHSKSPDNHFVVPRLHSSRKYTFKARAENAAGQSELSEESLPLLTSYPVQMVSKTSNSIIITWTSHPLREAASFDVQIRSLQDQGDLRTPFVALIDGLTEQYYEVKGLQPASFYQFRVRTTYSDEKERWEEDGIVSDEIRTGDDRPGPPTPPVVVPGTLMQTSATLQWTVERMNGQPILENEVTMSYKLNQWTLIGTSASDTLIATDLPVNRRLFFRVRARNAFGWSDYSPESRCLEIFVVPPPSTPAIVSYGSMWVELSFEPPRDFGVESYQLRMRKVFQEGSLAPVRDPATTATSEEVDGDDDGEGWLMYPATILANSVRVMDLTPLTIFCFQVRAQTVLGWSRWSGVSEPIKTARRL